MTQKIRIFKLIVLFAVFNSVQIYAQQDSVIIDSLTANNDLYYNLKYESLDLFLRDETRMFKFAISPFKPNEKYDFSIILSQLAYERKLNNRWSGLAELNQEFMFFQSGNILINSFDIGIRNYLIKEMQIRKGLSGNNCNGIYAGLKASNILVATKLINDDTSNNFVGFKPKPELGIGIQQRISNLFYIDANAFINYNFETKKPGYGLKLLIGLALNAGE